MRLIFAIFAFLFIFFLDEESQRPLIRKQSFSAYTHVYKNTINKLKMLLLWE